MKIHKLVQQFRTIPLRSTRCLKLPFQVTNDSIYSLEGATLFRRRVMLNVPGCKVSSCTMCNLPEDAPNIDFMPPTVDWLSQLKYAISADDYVDVLTLFNNGNFFYLAEVPYDTMREMLVYLSTTRINTLVVESLPQFITADIIKDVRTWLGPDIKLEVAIGLQCQDDFLRKYAIGSTCTSDDFLNAYNILGEYGYKVQTFVMYGIPFLTTSESGYELLQTLEWLYTHRVLAPTICPLHVVPGTLAFNLVERKMYTSPSYGELGFVLNTLLYQKPIEFKPRIARSLISNTNDPYHTSVLALIDAINSQKYDVSEVAWLKHELIMYSEEQVQDRLKSYLSLYP